MGYDLDGYIRRLKEAQKNLSSFTIDALKKNEAEIVDLNISQMEESGVTHKGEEIQRRGVSYRGYSPMTVQIKRLKGQETKHITLKDEGDFHNKMKIVYNQDSFTFTSDDDKTEELQSYYSDIFGLTDQNIEEMKDLIKPDLINIFRNEVIDG